MNSARSWCRLFFVVWPLLTWPAVVGTSAAGGPLLPADGEVPGWKKAGPQRIFTAADLYGFIDGGAELFLEFGFTDLTVQSYRKDAGEISVEIYRMTDTAAAAGIYWLKCGRETPSPRLQARHTANRYQVQLMQQRYYLVITNQSNQPELEPRLLDFAARVAERLPAPEYPGGLLDRLPAAGRVAGSIRLLRGTYSLQAVYPLGEGDLLNLQGKNTAVAARYRDGDGGFLLILASYGSPAEAREAFGILTSGLDPYLKILSKETDRIVLQDFQHNFAEIGLAGAVIRLRLELKRRP